MTRAAWRHATLVAALAAGCAASDASNDDSASCSDSQRTLTGVCCAPWADAAQDVCVLRPWGRKVAVVSDPGARHPTATLDHDGRAIIAWAAADGPQTEIMLAVEQAEGGVAHSFPGAQLEGNGVDPHLAADALGRVMLTWREQVGSDGQVFVAERDADGAWTLPGPDDALSHPPTGYEPRAVYAPSGETFVVFNQWTGENFGAALARRPADELDGPLTPPKDAGDVLSPPVLFSNAPRMAVAANGDALVTWYQSPGGPLMTYVSERHRDSGAFSRPGVDDFISPPGAPVDGHAESNPMPAIHARGAGAIVWTQENGAGAVPVYLATRDSRGSWTTPADLADSFTVPDGVARCPQIAFGDDGGLYIVWYEQPTGGPFSVRAVYRRPDGTWAEGGDAPAVLSTPQRGDGVAPSLAVGPRGEALVAFAQQSDEGWEIVARRRNPDAGTWLPPEVVSAPNRNEVVSDATVAIGPDRAIVVWVSGSVTEGRVHLASTAAP